MKRFLLGLLLLLVASPAFAQLPVCNNGDMIYRGAVGYQCVAYSNVAGYFLQSNGAGGAPTWTLQAPNGFLLPTQSTNTFLGNVTGSNASPSAVTVSNILDTIGYDISRPPAVGALIYKSATAPGNAWQTLSPAPTGYLLTSGGAGAAPYWVANATQADLDSICAVQGSVLYRTNTAWACLPPATAGYLLSTGGAAANPSWIASSTLGTALTKTDDTNVTLTLGGAPTTALVNATSITVGWTGTLAAARLNSNVVQAITNDTNVTGSITAQNLTLGWTGTLAVPRGGTGFGTYAVGDILYADTTTTLAKLADVATGNALLSGGVGVAPSWGKVTASQITAAALTKTDDTNVTLTLGGSPTTALVNAASLTLGWTGTLGLTRGGAGGSLTASNGGIVYSDASRLQILAGTGTPNQCLLSGTNSAPSWGGCATATVSSIAGNVGAFTLSNGITNSTNDIRLATIATGNMLANASGGSAVPTATKLPYIARATATFTTDATSSTSTVYEFVLTGGGGGSGGANGASAAGSGGGAGGTCLGTFTGVAAGATVTITVGGGGSAGGIGGNGGTGTSSTIAATGITTITATGGTGGQGTSTSVASAGTGGSCTTGTGVKTVTGGSGMVGNPGSGSTLSGGAGGASYWGGGSSNPNAALSCNPVAGAALGSGASGACSTGLGGAVGAAGAAEVKWISVQ